MSHILKILLNHASCSLSYFIKVNFHCSIMVKVSLPNLSDFIFSYGFGLQEEKNSFCLQSHAFGPLKSPDLLTV